MSENQYINSKNRLKRGNYRSFDQNIVLVLDNTDIGRGDS